MSDAAKANFGPGGGVGHGLAWDLQGRKQRARAWCGVRQRDHDAVIGAGIDRGRAGRRMVVRRVVRRGGRAMSRIMPVRYWVVAIGLSLVYWWILDACLP